MKFLIEKSFLIAFVFFMLGCSSENNETTNLVFVEPDNKDISYIGRIDFSDIKAPRFWQPGITVSFSFEGEEAKMVLQDELLWGKNKNYYTLVVDGKAHRQQMKSGLDTIDVTPLLSAEKKHAISIVKDTEANIGYLVFKGAVIKGKLLPAEEPLKRKIEFIGNSITCGMGSDAGTIPCGQNEWYDQHNAYMSYGAITARALNAEHHLSSVSGIGLMRSCCDMKIIMPEVYDKINMHGNKVAWNFANYQPDVISICLGQNDGIQNATIFIEKYTAFLKQVRNHNPQAKFVLLSSPMADEALRNFQREVLASIVSKVKEEGDNTISSFVFEKSYNGGCDYHPSLQEHKEIAEQVTSFIKKEMGW